MKPLVDRLLPKGCLATALLFVYSLVHCLVYGWKHIVWTGALLAFGIVLLRYSGFRHQRTIHEMLQASFASRGLGCPSCESTSRYGFPAYELCFSTMQAEDDAKTAGGVDDFEARIQEFHRNDGWKTRPFDADSAVTITNSRRKRRLAS